MAKIHSLPGVRDTVAATGLPVEGTHHGVRFEIAGTPSLDPRSRPDAAFQAVTPSSFEAFGVQMVKGRSFNQQDTAGAVPVAVVNENFVRRYLANVDPLTQRIVAETVVPGAQRQQPLVQWQIVGVLTATCAASACAMTTSLRWTCRFGRVPGRKQKWPCARRTIPQRLPGASRTLFPRWNPICTIANVRTMTQIVDSRLAGDRFSTVLYGSFATLALLLAAIGIYGVLAFAVAERTREIGLRLVLGAGRGQVLRMILREGIALAFFGLGLGAAGALLVGRVLKSMLYGVAAIDVGVFAAVAVTLLASVLACYIPARRASRVDPMVALRYE